MTLPFDTLSCEGSDCLSPLAKDGYAFVPADAMSALLGEAARRDWDRFAASWDDLEPDLYMADGGRYRRRRHAVFEVTGGEVRRLPHRPHFQTLAHNPLNGGIERWFAPIKPEITKHPAFTSLLALCNDAFSPSDASAAAPSWFVEAHQFRIEAQGASAGKPTPEGIHRDGVNWVCILLINRVNVSGGETILKDDSGQVLAHRTLSRPLDALFLNDLRVLHGASAVHAVNAETLAYRDVLVLTYRSYPV
jgi:hypothetical protein